MRYKSGDVFYTTSGLKLTLTNLTDEPGSLMLTSDDGIRHGKAAWPDSKGTLDFGEVRAMFPFVVKVAPAPLENLPVGSFAWFDELIKQIDAECNKTNEQGRAEYAHNEGNVFANFDRTGAELDLERRKVLWIFFRKHCDGIVAHLNGHESQRESVLGRIKDAIVYLKLLWGMEVARG